MPEASAEPLRPAETAALFSKLAGVDALLVGVSGGPDSVALLGLLAQWAAQNAVKLSSATVDHDLRDGSRAEAEQVARFAASLGVSHSILTWDSHSTGEFKKPAVVSQEAARDARYRLLGAHMRAAGITHLVTGHTLDDQAETILLRFLRGSGPAGLIGMQMRAETNGIVLHRPLLNVAKSRLIATCKERGWTYVADPSNENPRFTRVRLRRLLPELAKEGLSKERLVTLGRRMGRVEKAIEAQVGAVWAKALVGLDETTVTLRPEELAGQPELIVERVLQKGLVHIAGARHIRLERLENLTVLLQTALHNQVAFRRSLAGCLIDFNGQKQLKIVLAPPRAGKTALEQ